jgi:hypothetical protein
LRTKATDFVLDAMWWDPMSGWKSFKQVTFLLAYSMTLSETRLYSVGRYKVR